ncbi:WXG100 family type VII secretion target [Streptomyces erythrochromogenes]|uniref:WXG100 family type VII secretion target n=1 Tax=Streptomyces erythrochromogenes TaxID=285574 RepID=UPI00386E0270|nr:WXG100 family type VII secretion target [Streptomyces erythrochromogenes]
MVDVDGTPIYVGEGLAAAGGWLNARAGEVSGELQGLKSQLIPLADSWRESHAATYYQDMQDEWDLAANGLFGPDGVLGRIAHAMNVNWNNYSDAEWSNMSTWRR